jgi:hypothetical protein
MKAEQEGEGNTAEATKVVHAHVRTNELIGTRVLDWHTSEAWRWGSGQGLTWQQDWRQGGNRTRLKMGAKRETAVKEGWRAEQR